MSKELECFVHILVNSYHCFVFSPIRTQEDKNHVYFNSSLYRGNPGTQYMFNKCFLNNYYAFFFFTLAMQAKHRCLSVARLGDFSC